MSYPVLKTPRLTLRMPQVEDIDSILDFYLRNREFFAPTDPPLPEGFYTREYWEKRIANAHREFEEDRSVRFYLFEGAGESKARILGSMSFTQFIRGPFQACYMGYAIDEKEQGKGLTTEAGHAAIAYVFREKNLHRIMANHLPENQASARVLAKLGFRVEGIGKDYLFIRGAWRDHVLNALTHPAWRES